jgi:ParB-like chromosome segregation protein Spo0J
MPNGLADDDRGEGAMSDATTPRRSPLPAAPTPIAAGPVAAARYEGHPHAGVFPRLEGYPFEVLCEDIKTNGLQEPIVLFEGKILDGRNRYSACRREGVEVRTREYMGNDPLGFVLSANLHRRHLNESQRALIGAEIANNDLGANQHTQKEGASIDTASERLNVSRASILRARKVLVFGSKEDIHKIKKGELAVSNAVKKAKENAKNVEGGTTDQTATTSNTGNDKKGGGKGQSADANKPPAPHVEFKALREQLIDKLLAFPSIELAEDYVEETRKRLETAIEQLRGNGAIEGAG